MRACLTVLSLILAPAVAGADTLRDHALTLFAPLPDRVEAVEGVAVTPERVELGRMLFFDPRLSDTGQFACATCHNPATGGDSNRATSIGHAWQTGPQNAPTIFNAVLNRARFWQGWAEDLPRSGGSVLTVGAERTGTPARVVSVLASMPAYVEAFEAAFPGEVDPVTFGNFAAALSAYEATLLTPAPFDAWLAGDDAALTAQARESSTRVARIAIRA